MECSNFKKKTPQKRGPKTDFKKQGKANRAKGARFELKARKHFEDEGWIVTKWHNNIDLQTDEIIQAKNHYIPKRGLTMGKGFPDFLMFQKSFKSPYLCALQFVECKTNGKLDKQEKEKLDVLVKMGYTCFVASLEDRKVKMKRFMGYENKS